MRDENTSCSPSEGWHVKWGFDPGDCFTVFPLLPALPGESEEDRLMRSFHPLKAKGEMLCIESSVVEALLRRMLEEHFDANRFRCIAVKDEVSLFALWFSFLLRCPSDNFRASVSHGAFASSLGSLVVIRLMAKDF